MTKLKRPKRKANPRKIEPDYVREAKDQLKILMDYRFTPEDLNFLSEENVKIKKARRYKHSRFNKPNYVKGVLDKLYLLRQTIYKDISPVTEHIEFLRVLGLNYEEIVYCLYTFGYVNASLDFVEFHLRRYATSKKIEELKREYMAEINILKRAVFQDMASQVLSEEKKYLETLLKNLPVLRAALDETDPVIEKTKWARLNKQIQEILDKTKSMHGIDEIRFAQVKTEAAITVQNNKILEGGERLPILPNPRRHPELEDGRIIELQQDDKVLQHQEEQL